MIRFHIEYHFYGRKKREEGVRVLTGLRQENIGLSYPKIPSDILHHSTNGNRGIHLCFHQNLSNHGGRRRLSVRSGDIDGFLVIPHNPSKELRTAHHGNPPSLYFL